MARLGCKRRFGIGRSELRGLLALSTTVSMPGASTPDAPFEDVIVALVRSAADYTAVWGICRGRNASPPHPQFIDDTNIT